MLVEEEHDVGGHLRWGTDAELAALRQLAEAVAADDAIEVLTDAVVFGRYGGNLVAAAHSRSPAGNRIIGWLLGRKQKHD